jgi:tetratricopeptide (TPR) repeat protein
MASHDQLRQGIGHHMSLDSNPPISVRSVAESLAGAFVCAALSLASATSALQAAPGSPQSVDPAVTVDQRLRAVEERLNVALAVKDERIETATAHLNELYMVFEIFGVIAGFGLVVLTVRDVRLRAQESARQQSIDDIVKDMMRLQRVAAEQQIRLSEARVPRAGDNVEQEFRGMQEINEVISVVRSTLDFRLQQEAKVAETLAEVHKSRRERDETRKHKLDQIIAINQNFKSMSRMQFSALGLEQQKRGLRLVSLANDLDLSTSQDLGLDVGAVFLSCGAIMYYDNDVVEAKSFLARAAESRLPDHIGSLETNQDYRKRFALIHYFTCLVEKNWGELNRAFAEIEESVKFFNRTPTEFLSPATKAEILSYMGGQEMTCRAELTALRDRVNDLEKSLQANGQALNSNQLRLRSRIVLLLGNVACMQRDWQEAVALYAEVNKADPENYYALGASALVLSQLNDPTAAAMARRCVEAFEKAGDFRRKREITTKAVLAAMVVGAARICGDEAKVQLYRREAKELLSASLDVDGMSPRFFSPATRRLVSQFELLNEINS